MIALFLFLIAGICLLLAAFGIPSRVGLGWIGLFFWLLGERMSGWLP